LSLEIEKLKNVTPDIEQRTLHVFAQTIGGSDVPAGHKAYRIFLLSRRASGFDLLVVGVNNVYSGILGGMASTISLTVCFRLMGV